MELFWGTNKALQAAAFYLRYQVFVLEQRIAPEDEFDELDNDQTLYGIYFEGTEPIATIRYQKDSPTQLHPDRFCVAAPYRNRGIGKKLLLALEAKGITDGCQTSILSAEITAQHFYENLGYQQISEPFLEDGIHCVTMKKNLVFS